MKKQIVVTFLSFEAYKAYKELGFEIKMLFRTPMYRYTAFGNKYYKKISN